LFRAHEQTRERERRIEQLNRTYQVLSDVNQTIVRARGTSELYERICNIAVDQGDFLLAWLGRPDEASGLVEPVAADREHAGHLSAVPGGLEQAEQGDPTVRAYRSGAAAVDNGSGNGEGPQSVASLPVLVFGETRLLLTLHAPLPDFFDEEELALLQELVMDLGFAIEAREHEARRIEAEEQRREWEELISYVIEHDPTAITVLDTELRHVFVSARFCEDYRVSKEDVLGRHHYEVFPEIPDRWREVHARALKGEILRSQDDRFVRLDGSVDYTRWECRPWYRRNGEIGGIVLYTEVITGLREAEERRRTVLAALEALLSASPDLVSMVDADGRYWMISDSVAEMVGRAKEEIIGRPFEDVLPPTVSEDFRRSVARVVESGSGFSKTDVVPAEDGERTYRTTLFPARETDGTVSLIGIISVELSPTGRE
jgi:PAS domain S-box-containing protein